MPINHDREKMLNAMIFFAKNTKHCGKTKLYKLLYYLDFTHFKETGRPVTGLKYFTWDFGPAPQELHEDLQTSAEDISKSIALIGSTDSFVSIKAKKPFNKKHFTKRELRILNELCEIFIDAQAEHMVEASHVSELPWDKTKKSKGMYQEIDYFLALDEPDAIPTEEAIERIADKEKIISAFE